MCVCECVCVCVCVCECECVCVCIKNNYNISLLIMDYSNTKQKIFSVNNNRTSSVFNAFLSEKYRFTCGHYKLTISRAMDRFLDHQGED